MGLLDPCAPRAQEVLELPRPRLLQLFMDERQLPQVVGSAQRVTSGVKVPIARPAVVHTDSPVARHDANRLQGGRAMGGVAGGVAGVVGERRRTRDMRPRPGRSQRRSSDGSADTPPSTRRANADPSARRVEDLAVEDLAQAILALRGGLGHQA
jgi:hypothetical protein